MSEHGRRPTRSSFLAAAGAAFVAGAHGADARPPGPAALLRAVDSGQYGALLDQTEFARAPQAVDPGVLAQFRSQQANGATGGALPARHIVANLPPVKMQGTPGQNGFPGTCEAQSFGYCLGTQTASRTQGHTFSPALRANQISAAWLFAWQTNLTGATTCQGTPALGYLNHLVAHGAPSAADVPYKPNCAYLSGGQIDLNLASYGGVKRFEIGSFSAFSGVHNQARFLLPMFRRFLRNGHTIAFSGVVAKGYGAPATAMVNGAFDPQTFLPHSGHGQTIVGFDDSLGHTGAFLVQNSFGTAWPGLSSTDPLLQGRLWWTYESFFASQYLAAIAFPIAPRPPSPAVVLHANVSSAPDAWLAEAIRAELPSPGMVLRHGIVVEPGFSAPVQLHAVTLTPPQQSAVVAQYNNPIRSGFVHIERPGPFAYPPGKYTIELHASTIATGATPAQSIVYTGTFHLR